MAIINYDSFGYDLLKVRFKCCKHGKETALISPEIPIGKHSRHCEVKAMCGCKYGVHMEVRMLTTTMEIIGLPQENVISSHPIWWEYYIYHDTECVDWIVERGNIERCMEAIAQLDDRNRIFIYRMLWCKIISMMDAYCHHAISRRVLSDKEKWDIFYEVRNRGKPKKEWKKEEFDSILQQTNFLSINFIVNVLDKVFGIHVVPDEKIAHAVHVRNMLIHTQGIGRNREMYVIGKNELEDLFKSVNAFISNIDKRFLDYDTEQIPHERIYQQSNNKDL